ncbi:MAG: hypothetical protein JSV80_17015, partial [Acidobacteriota bacterium]
MNVRWDVGFSIAAIVSALLTFVLLASCGNREDEAVAGVSAEPQRGGTLVVGVPSAPDSLNIYLARTSASLLVAHRVLPRLAEERFPGEQQTAGLEPLLAESWRFEEDEGPTLVFRLRGGGRWSNGDPIRCED